MERVRRIGLLMAIGLVSGALALSAIGCSKTAPEPTESPQAVFESLVDDADAAWTAGDATRAYELYMKAVETTGSTDPNGEVAAKLKQAKELMLARQILATTEPSLSSLSPYVQALLYVSADSTEGVAARERLASCLDTYPETMTKEVAEMRSAIKSGQGVRKPLTVYLVAELASGWRTEIEQAPGETGVHLVAAVEAMKAASDSVEAALGREYAEDALDDLKAADSYISQAQAEFKLAREGAQK